MMRGCIKAFVAFGLVAALAGPVLAQGRGGFGGMGDLGMLIGNPGVQKELKLDDAQVEKAKALGAAMRDKIQENRSQLEGLEGQELNKKRMEIVRANHEEAVKSLGAFLKPEQLDRLKQIELQQRGGNVLSDPAVFKQLNITGEQAEKIKAILTTSQSETREFAKSAGGDRQAAMQKWQAHRKETTLKVMALLTDDQKKTWKEMTGEPFQVTFQPRGQ